MKYWQRKLKEVYMRLVSVQRCQRRFSDEEMIIWTLVCSHFGFVLILILVVVTILGNCLVQSRDQLNSFSKIVFKFNINVKWKVMKLLDLCRKSPCVRTCGI